MIVLGKKKGEITFVCTLAPETQTAYLVGSFNNWHPTKHPMAKRNDGSFRKKLTLEPGRYEYKFIVDGIWLNDMEAEENIMNSYGTMNSVVYVE
jgi:1,4-alpha-glucan branching enzyme